MVTLRFLAISRKKVKIKTYSDPRIFHILTLQLQDKRNGNAVSGRSCIHNCVSNHHTGCRDSLASYGILG